MIKENMVMFAVSAYNCKDVNKLKAEIMPANHINSKWIAQTIADEVWIWFEFKNKEDKQKYIDWINSCDVICTGIMPDDNGDIVFYPKDMMSQDRMSQEMVNHWTN